MCKKGEDVAGTLLQFIAELPWNISARGKVEGGRELNPGGAGDQLGSQGTGDKFPVAAPAGMFARQQHHIPCPAGGTSAQGHTLCAVTPYFTL